MKLEKGGKPAFMTVINIIDVMTYKNKILFQSFLDLGIINKVHIKINETIIVPCKELASEPPLKINFTNTLIELYKLKFSIENFSIRCETN